MAKLEILEFPDPRLRTQAKPVTVFDAASWNGIAIDSAGRFPTGAAFSNPSELKRLLTRYPPEVKSAAAWFDPLLAADQDRASRLDAIPPGSTPAIRAFTVTTTKLMLNMM